MILIFIAFEIWLFGAMCAWFTARTPLGKNVVIIAAFGVAGLGVLVVESARNPGISTWEAIR